MVHGGGPGQGPGGVPVVLLLAPDVLAPARRSPETDPVAPRPGDLSETDCGLKALGIGAQWQPRVPPPRGGEQVCGLDQLKTFSLEA